MGPPIFPRFFSGTILPGVEAPVLPGADAAAARIVAERIRSRIESAVLAPAHGVRATVSIGIALPEARDPDHREWIARADQALYRAKAGGRNRAVLFDAGLHERLHELPLKQ